MPDKDYMISLFVMIHEFYLLILIDGNSKIGKING